MPGGVTVRSGASRGEVQVAVGPEAVAWWGSRARARAGGAEGHHQPPTSEGGCYSVESLALRLCGGR